MGLARRKMEWTQWKRVDCASDNQNVELKNCLKWYSYWFESGANAKCIKQEIIFYHLNELLLWKLCIYDYPN